MVPAADKAGESEGIKMKNIKDSFNNFKNNAREKIDSIKNKEGRKPSTVKEAIDRAKLRSRQNTCLRVYHERRQTAETARLNAHRAYEDVCRIVGRQIDINQIFEIADPMEVAAFVDNLCDLPVAKKVKAVSKITAILVCTAQAEVLDEDAEVWEGYLTRLGVQREEPIIEMA
jgi:hypothetical protein